MKKQLLQQNPTYSLYCCLLSQLLHFGFWFLENVLLNALPQVAVILLQIDAWKVEWKLLQSITQKSLFLTLY